MFYLILKHFILENLPFFDLEQQPKCLASFHLAYKMLNPSEDKNPLTLAPITQIIKINCKVLFENLGLRVWIETITVQYNFLEELNLIFQFLVSETEGIENQKIRIFF